RSVTDAAPWRIWQANGFDSRQIAVHRAALAYGYSYVTVLPGELPNGEPMPVMRGVSPRRMLAFYEDPVEDDWPAIAMQAVPAKKDGNRVWHLKVYDDNLVHHLEVGELDSAATVRKDAEEHGLGHVPVV